MLLKNSYYLYGFYMILLDYAKTAAATTTTTTTTQQHNNYYSTHTKKTKTQTHKHNSIF